jgi:hypothetical protein
MTSSVRGSNRFGQVSQACSPQGGAAKRSQSDSPAPTAKPPHPWRAKARPGEDAGRVDGGTAGADLEAGGREWPGERTR